MKKTILSLGSILTMATPIVAVVSCGDGKDAKTQAQKQTATTGNNDSGQAQQLWGTTTLADRLNGSSKPAQLNRNFVAKASDWKTNINYEVMQGNFSTKPFVKDAQNHDTKNHTVKKVDMLETDMFRYAVEMGGHLSYVSDVISHEQIEQIAKQFEKNVNYGIGAHWFWMEDEGSYRYIEKPVIEFLIEQNGVISWGASKGVQISLVPATSQYATNGYAWASNDGTVPTAPSRQVVNQAGLLLHEYGHHETIVTNDMIGTQGVDERNHVVLFQKVKEEMNKDPDLKPFLKYWDKTERPGNNPATASHAWTTPFGTTKASDSYFTPFGYTMKSAEFLTRFEMFMSSMKSLDGFDIINSPQWKTDIVGINEAFNDGTFNPFAKNVVEKMANIYRKYVYHYDRYGKYGILGHFVKQKDTFDKVKISITASGVSGNSTWTTNKNDALTKLGFDASANGFTPEKTKTFEFSGNEIQSKDTEFRYNTDFATVGIEATEKGKMYTLNYANLNDDKKALYQLITMKHKGITVKYEFFKGATKVATVDQD